MAGKRRRPAEEDGMPPSLQIPPHTHCSIARLPPTHPFLLGALILQLHFQVRWRALRAPLAPILRQVRRTAQPDQSYYSTCAPCVPVCACYRPSFPCRFPDDRTPIEASLFQRHLRSLVWGLGLDSLSHSSSHTLSFFATLFSHTIPFPRVH